MFQLKKKLIEVALPLDVINKESAREKSIRHGHPSTLHLWWARRPLATARAVLFASLVDDPSEHPEKFPTLESQEQERKRLFTIIWQLVKWENYNNESILNDAMAEIKKSIGENLPAVLDPFAGGGTIPLEAQRLGLKAFAYDLNPVAIMINKAMIEIPAQFKNNQPPINPDIQSEIRQPDNPERGIFNEIKNGYHGAADLAEDIKYYGNILKKRAFEKIGNLYPKIEGKTVIAWLWARTVTCSNPACGCQMPLVHSFKLSTKQNTSVKPVIHDKEISFEICQNDKNIPDGTVNRNGARCLFCGANVPLDHVRNEAKAGRMSAKLMAIVAEGDSGRVYLPPNDEHEKIAAIDKPDDYPEGKIADAPRYLSPPLYGLEDFSDLFTNRQLTALTTFGDLISEIQEQVQEDGGSKNYADAVTVYLAFLVDRLAMFGNSFCHWDNTRDGMAQIFIRQAIPMQWDFAEANPFSNSSGCFDNMLEWIYKSVSKLPTKTIGEVKRHSALEKFNLPEKVMVSTDPPYYDNISYADLSEFFYVWLRRPLKNIYPEILGRMTFQKDNELIATPYRHNGSKAAAKEFFESGMLKALQNIYEVARADFPVTIYYAFKQQESDSASSGWETMLNSIIRAGFQITATLPMRTELTTALKNSVNALASSIVLACRKRPPENKICGKNEFISQLKTELKTALEKMQQANIAPVDMAQAAIGPGISVYSRYEKITDMSDNPVTVRDALKIINAELDVHLNGQSRHLDAATQFCVDFFTQKAFDIMKFGDADTLARAKNISVDKLEEIGAVISKSGNVSLCEREELEILDDNGNLVKDSVDKLLKSKCAWLWVQSLVEVFGSKGIQGAAKLLANFEGDTESLKNLAYRLYDICEKRHWAQEATSYNELVVEWQDILDNSNNYKKNTSINKNSKQLNLFEG